MALEGSLKEFGLADILQLIYFQRKTGVLTIEGRTDRVRLGFYEGRIVFAESRRRSEDRIGKILIKKGILSEEKLQKAIEEQKTTAGAKLGSILLKNNFATKQQLQDILASQITEVVVQLFTWKEGKYDFQPQGIPLDKDIPLSVDTQHLLMEGLRILDEWSLVEGKITLDSVFQQTGEEDVELTDEERELLNFVDGESDVNTIAAMSGGDNIQVSKTMLSLGDKGVIALKEAPVVIPKLRIAAPRREVPGIVAKAAVLIALVISVAVVLVFGIFSIDDMRASEAVDALRFNIEVSRYGNGSYPASIDSKDLWGRPYVYSAEGEGFVLKSPGKDGLEGTKDDLY